MCRWWHPSNPACAFYKAKQYNETKYNAVQCFSFLTNGKMKPKTCYFPLERLCPFKMLNVTLNSGKNHQQTKHTCVMCWYAFYFHNFLWLFIICISKPVGSRFGQVKFRTGKFSPGIAFTICTNQFHSQGNGFESLKLVPQMALKKCNMNFR